MQLLVAGQVQETLETVPDDAKRLAIHCRTTESVTSQCQPIDSDGSDASTKQGRYRDKASPAVAAGEHEYCKPICKVIYI